MIARTWTTGVAVVLAACNSPADRASAPAPAPPVVPVPATAAPVSPPRPDVFITLDGRPGAIAVVGDTVYYGDGNSLRAVSIATRKIRRLAEPGLIPQIAVRGDTVYFTVIPSAQTVDRNSYLESVHTAGGKPTKLETFPRLSPKFALVDGGIALALCCGERSKLQIRAPDGTRRTLHEWTTDGELAIASAGPTIYVANDAEDQVLRVTGDEVEVLASNERDVRSVAVDDMNVYWTNTNDRGALRRQVKPERRHGRPRSEVPETILHAFDPRILAQDDEWIYVVAGEDSHRTLRRWNKAAGPREELMPAIGIAQVVPDEHGTFVVVSAEANGKAQILRFAPAR